MASSTEDDASASSSRSSANSRATLAPSTMSASLPLRVLAVPARAALVSADLSRAALVSAVPARAALVSPVPARAALVSAVLAVAAGCAALGGGAPNRFTTYDARTFFAIETISGASFSPDESRILVTSDRGGAPDAWIVDADASVALGARERQRALAEPRTNPIVALEWFPTDDRVLYASDQGGNELAHLYVRHPDGSVVDLTPGEGVRASYVGWSADGASFFALTNEREPRSHDLYRYTSRAVPGGHAYDRELLWTATPELEVAAVSPDGRRVALVRHTSLADSDLFVVDRTDERPEPRIATPHEREELYRAVGFSPDGTRLYYVSDRADSHLRLWSYDLATAGHALELDADGDVVAVAHSPDGRRRAAVVEREGRGELLLFDLEHGRARAADAPSFDDASVHGPRFSRSGARLAFYVSSDTSPPDLHVLDEGAEDALPLTRALPPAVDVDDLVRSELVRFSSEDELDIPARLYVPHAAHARPLPAIVHVHGGVGARSSAAWNGEIQFLVNHGYAVLSVDPRGTAGYGKKFARLDDRRHGQADLADCIAAHDWLVGRGWVHPDRIAVQGSGYGGYLALAALTFAPHVFDAAVDAFGPTNWVRTLESLPPWRAAHADALRAEIGDPGLDRDRLRAISPLFHTDGIRAPLLVVQGANDPLVPRVESEALVDAVRAAGRPAEYVLLEEEGHALLRRANRITAAEAILRFLDRHLDGASR